MNDEERQKMARDRQKDVAHLEVFGKTNIFQLVQSLVFSYFLSEASDV